MFTRLSIAGIVSAIVLIAATHVPGASAQYPPPSGNCTLTIDASQVNAGGTAGVKVTVRDADGNLLSGETVTVTITQQPGSDASVSMNSSTTNASGEVTGTLNVGTTAGTVKLGANAAGAACSAQVVVVKGEVQGEVEGEVILPNTGSGGSADAGRAGLLTIVLLAGAGAATLALGARRRSTRG